ncbi:MAG: tetratricopeptide repeat protein [Candidatus Hydrogenedens sp.]|nr:tetratricopeptide repeat protein [Candidatus Hydrogenedens sp.]
MRQASRLLLSLVVFSLAAHADESARTQVARLEPAEPDAGTPSAEVLLVGNGAQDIRLAAAHHAYTLWTQQMQGALVTDDQADDWRGFLGMDIAAGEAYKQLGEAAFNESRYTDAAELFAIARDFLPQDGELLKNLGFSLKSAGRYEEALEVLRDAIAVYGSDPQVWLWMGDTQRLLGDFQSAVSSYYTARDMANPKDAESYQEYIAFTETLASITPDWDAFEMQRGFATRHDETNRVRRKIAQYMYALRVAPEEGIDATDADFRRGWVNLAMGEQFSFIQEVPVAYDYFHAGLALYKSGESQTDIMRGLQALAVACENLAILYPRESERWHEESSQHWSEAAKIAQGLGDVEYLRYLNGGLLRTYAASKPLDAPEVVELRDRIGKELPWRGPINDYTLASAAEGEIACRLREGDFGGARVLIEMSSQYYKDTGFLVDLEHHARALASLASVYYAQEHYGKTIEVAAEGLEQIGGLRRFLDADAYNRSVNPSTVNELAALQAAAAVQQGEFEQALDYAESFQAAYRHELFGSRVRNEAWRTDFATERELITARKARLTKELEDANAARDAVESARLGARLEEDAHRFTVLGHVDRLAVGPKLSYTGTVRKGAKEIIASLPEDTGVLYWLTGPSTGVAVWATAAGAGGVVLPEAARNATQALALQFADAWSAGEPAAIQSLLDEARAALAGPLDGALPQVKHWVIAADLLTGALPVTALLPDTSVCSRAASASTYLQQRDLGHAAVETMEAITPVDQASLQEAFKSHAGCLVAAEADFVDSAATLGILRFGDATEAVMLTGEALALEAPCTLAAFSLDVKQSNRGLPAHHADALAEAMAVAGTRSVVMNRLPVDAGLRAAFFDAFGAAIGQGTAAALQAGRDAVRAAAPDSPAWTAFEVSGPLD